jgi:hypothetical protein
MRRALLPSPTASRRNNRKELATGWIQDCVHQNRGAFCAIQGVIDEEVAWLDQRKAMEGRGFEDFVTLILSPHRLAFGEIQSSQSAQLTPSREKRHDLVIVRS